MTADSRDTPDRGERIRFTLALTASAGILFALALPMLQGQVFAYDDLGNFHLPIRLFYSRCLADGDSFTWYPNVFCGYYLHGEGQAGMCHPLHLALYGGLPIETAFNFELLLCYPFLLAGTFLFLRRWDLPLDAAMFGAMVFAFSGFNLLHYIHLNALAIVAHIPWMLFLIDVALRETNLRKIAFALAGLALLTGSELLLGYPQYVWFSGLGEGLYALFLALRFGHGWRLLLLLLAKVLGIAVGAVQLLPTMDALSASVREKPTESFLSVGSLFPGNLLQLVAPYLFVSRAVSRATEIGTATHEYGLYAGAVVPVLLVWLIVRRKHLGPRRPLAVAALVLALVSLVLAFGSYTPLFAVTSRLPVVGLFRESCRTSVLFYFALAVLAALGYADLTRAAREQPGSVRSLWVFALLQLVSILAAGLKVWALAKPTSSFAPYLASLGPVLAGPALVLAATALVLAAARGIRVALAGIILLAAADQGFYGLTFVYHQPPTTISALAASQPLPPDGPGYRIAVGGSTTTGIWLLSGAHLTDGYLGLPPRRYLPPRKEGTLRLAGASFVREGESWRRVPNPLPRAWLVTWAVESENPPEDAEGVDLRTTAVVNQPVALPWGRPGVAGIVMDRPGRIRIETTADTRQLLVLSESYHPGWQVAIDDQPEKVVRVWGDFMGCVVPAGQHEVEFEFRPRSFLLGEWLSAGGVALVLALLVVMLLFSRQRR
jgi:hypothetical protein